MRFFLFTTFAALLFFANPLWAEKTDIKTGGYIKNFFILTDYRDDTAFEALSRLRLSLNIRQSESASFELAYDLLPRLREQGANSGVSLPVPELLSYRVFDLNERLYPENKSSGSDFALTQNLDRAFLTLTISSYDVYIGRQPVAFGSARVTNPSDIIAPFTYNAIAKEELAGVDAIRVKRPLAEMGEIDIGIVFGDYFEPDKSAGFIRLKSYLFRTDISLMTTVFRKNVLLGLDMARSIGGAGAWFEAAQTLAGRASHYRPEENYFRLSAGSDYSFTGKLYAYIEYHYNGAGTGSPSNYFNAISETAFTDGAVYLLGKHYIAPGFKYAITPLLIFNAQSLVNMEDGSALASPGFDFNLAQDIYVETGAYLGLGKESTEPSQPESEFGLYPDIYYTSLNIYF